MPLRQVFAARFLLPLGCSTIMHLTGCSTTSETLPKPYNHVNPRKIPTAVYGQSIDMRL